MNDITQTIYLDHTLSTTPHANQVPTCVPAKPLFVEDLCTQTHSTDLFVNHSYQDQTWKENVQHSVILETFLHLLSEFV